MKELPLDYDISVSNRITSIKQIILFESIFKEYYHESMIYKTLEFQKERHKNGRKK